MPITALRRGAFATFIAGSDRLNYRSRTMRRFAALLLTALALALPVTAQARPGDRGPGNAGSYQDEDDRGDDRGRGNGFGERRRDDDGSYTDRRNRGRGGDDAQEGRRDFVPLEAVLRQIERRYPGHQLSVSGPSSGGGGYVYRIKWLTDDGAVLYIVADAESGAILSVDGG